MHARMHPSVSLRAAADHQQTVDMTCGAAVSSGTRTLQRSSSLPVGRPSSSRCCTARTGTAAGQGLIGRTGKQGRQVTSERGSPAAVGDSEGMRYGEHMRCETPGGRWGVPACPALQRRPETVSEPSRPWRVRGRARGPLILLQRLRVHHVNDWVRGCGLPVRGTAATTHGAGCWWSGALPSPLPFPTRFVACLPYATRYECAMAGTGTRTVRVFCSVRHETRPRSPAGPLLRSGRY